MFVFNICSRIAFVLLVLLTIVEGDLEGVIWMMSRWTKLVSLIHAVLNMKNWVNFTLQESQRVAHNTRIFRYSYGPFLSHLCVKFVSLLLPCLPYICWYEPPKANVPDWSFDFLSSATVFYGCRFKLDPRESLGIPPVSHLIVRSEHFLYRSKHTNADGFDFWISYFLCNPLLIFECLTWLIFKARNSVVYLFVLVQDLRISVTLGLVVLQSRGCQQRRKTGENKSLVSMPFLILSDSIKRKQFLAGYSSWCEMHNSHHYERTLVYKF